MKKIIFFTLLLNIGTSLWASDAELKSLMRESQPFDRGVPFTASVAAVVTSKQGKETCMQYNVYTKRIDDTVGSMIAFSYPPSLEGTRILTSVPEEGGIPDVTVKFKSFFATIKIPVLNPKVSFFGMDFSSGDMNPRNPSFDVYTLEDTIILDNGNLGYIIQAIQVKDKQYERILYYLDLTKKMIVRSEMFNKKNEMVKLMEVIECKKIQDIWSATKIKMSNLESDSNTTLTFTNLIYHGDYHSYVSVAFLKNGQL